MDGLLLHLLGLGLFCLCAADAPEKGVYFVLSLCLFLSLGGGGLDPDQNIIMWWVVA